MANKGDDKMDSWSIPRLVSSLKETFRAKDFVTVEDVLTAREKKLRTEIDKLKLEKQSFKDRYDSERLDKLSLKKELTGCKMMHKEFSDQVARLREDKMMLHKELGEKDKEIIDLRRRIAEMEYSKAKAEAEIEILNKKCKELDTRLLHIEYEMASLTNSKTAKTGTMITDNGNSQSEESGGVCEAKENQDNVEKTKEKVINPNTSNDAELGVGPSCGTMIKDNRQLQSEGIGKHPVTNVVEVTDDDDGCAPSGIQNGKEMTLKYSAEEGTRSGPTDRENRMLKRKRASGLDMSDFEDEQNIDDNTSFGEGKMKLQEATCKPDVSLSPLNCCTKNAVSYASNDVEKVFNPSTSRWGLEITRHCEEKMESEDRAGNVINVFSMASLDFEAGGSSESSESDSDSSDVDIDFLYSQLTQVPNEK